MDNHAHSENQKPGRRKRSAAPLIVLLLILILAAAAVIFFLTRGNEPAPTEPATLPSTVPATTAPATEESTEPPTEPPTERPMLESMTDLYAQNPEIIGWMTMEDTVLDYPVMQTPDDPEKYLHLNFDQNYAFAGELFVDARCTMGPDLEEESDNLIVYGHNMLNGTMFRPIMKYKHQSWWEDHPTFSFTTLYEERAYEIVAAFYDRVYFSYEDVFKFYQFIDAEDEEDFNEAVAYYKDHALYDTGVTPEYGDHLITLVTCSSYIDDGRFVVIGRLVTDDEIPEETTVS